MLSCYWLDALLILISSLFKCDCPQLIDILSPGKVAKTSTTAAKGCLAKGSVIVYVWRQKDAEAVAENIQASGVCGGVVVYHGGMDSADRGKAQSTVRLLILKKARLSDSFRLNRLLFPVYARKGSNLRGHGRVWSRH